MGLEGGGARQAVAHPLTPEQAESGHCAGGGGSETEAPELRADVDFLSSGPGPG